MLRGPRRPWLLGLGLIFEGSGLKFWGLGLSFFGFWFIFWGLGLNFEGLGLFFRGLGVDFESLGLSIFEVWKPGGHPRQPKRAPRSTRDEFPHLPPLRNLFYFVNLGDYSGVRFWSFCCVSCFQVAFFMTFCAQRLLEVTTGSPKTWKPSKRGIRNHKITLMAPRSIFVYCLLNVHVILV